MSSFALGNPLHFSNTHTSSRRSNPHSKYQATLLALAKAKLNTNTTGPPITLASRFPTMFYSSKYCEGSSVVPLQRTLLPSSGPSNKMVSSSTSAAAATNAVWQKPDGTEHPPLMPLDDAAVQAVPLIFLEFLAQAERKLGLEIPIDNPMLLAASHLSADVIRQRFTEKQQDLQYVVTGLIEANYPGLLGLRTQSEEDAATLLNGHILYWLMRRHKELLDWLTLHDAAMGERYAAV